MTKYFFFQAYLIVHMQQPFFKHLSTRKHSFGHWNGPNQIRNYSHIVAGRFALQVQCTKQDMLWNQLKETREVPSTHTPLYPNLSLHPDVSLQEKEIHLGLSWIAF